MEDSEAYYAKLLGNSLDAMKRLAETAEAIAVRDQESARRVIEAAESSKKPAEAYRKNVEDAEKRMAVPEPEPHTVGILFPAVRHVGQEEAIKIDEELFNEYKFSVDQLMELAGLSVASAIHRIYAETHRNKRVLVVAGPGNNGGDGMVAARHLKLFGFSDVVLLNARKPGKDLFINLVHQAERTDVTISYQAEPFMNDTSVGLIVDALFGFSFKPPVRPDFQPFMDLLTSAGTKPIISVDIPSGWDVEKGPPNETEQDSKNAGTFMPDTLVSLTAPKLCANFFKGRFHYLGGRFIPPKLAEKYALNLPPYPGTECIVRLQ